MNRKRKLIRLANIKICSIHKGFKRENMTEKIISIYNMKAGAVSGSALVQRGQDFCRLIRTYHLHCTDQSFKSQEGIILTNLDRFKIGFLS